MRSCRIYTALTLDVVCRWSASVVPLFVIALTLRTHRAVADRAAHQESAQDVLSPEQKRDLQYKSFAGLLSTMLIVRPHSSDVPLSLLHGAVCRTVAVDMSWLRLEVRLLPACVRSFPNTPVLVSHRLWCIFAAAPGRS